MNDRFNTVRQLASLGALTFYTIMQPCAASAAWKLDDALGTPDWLTIYGQDVTRYQSLDAQFRPGKVGSDQILLNRIVLTAEANADPFTFAVEGIDSRQWLADTGSVISTSNVDTLDIAQAYIAFTAKDLIQDGSTLTVKVGRETLNLGSRRLVARPNFRLTMNSFDGVDVHWKTSGGASLRLFYFHPVIRQPGAAAVLLDNEAELDTSTGNLQLFGAFAEMAELPLGSRLEFYYMGLQEEDSDFRPTANRSLHTPGFRWFRKAKSGEIDFEVETVLQIGESRSSTSSSNTTDLDHRAYFQHLALGYTFDMPWSPRIVLEYDYASGDEDPNDGENGRFDTLYGVARPDFGPTCLYNATARANVSSPGYHLTFKPTKRFDVMFAERLFWLASDKDSWAGVRDTTGNSGDFVGHQVEIRLKFDAIPGNLNIETGAAYLMAGEFMDNAPNSPKQGDVVYGYVQTTLKF